MSNVIYDQGQAPWDDGTTNSTTKTMFGDMDIIANNAAGVSYADQLAFYEANPSQQGGGGYNPGTVGAGSGAHNPGSVNFNPGGIDMGGQAPTWSNEDFIRSLAKDRAQEYTNGSRSINLANQQFAA